MNLVILLQLYPCWSAVTTVEFLSGAFELFHMQHPSLEIILMLVSTAFSLSDGFEQGP